MDVGIDRRKSAVGNNGLNRYLVTYGVRVVVLVVGFVLLGLFAVLVYSVYFFAFELKGAIASRDIATSRIASAAQGYAEIVGRGATGHLLPAPCSHTDCLWYSYIIDRKRQAGGGFSWSGTAIKNSDSIAFAILVVLFKLFISKDDDNWERVESGTSENDIVLNDGSGLCHVNPKGARMSDLDYTIWYEGDYRYQESLLLPAKPVYVLGNFVTQTESQTNARVTQAVGALIREWKRDQAYLKSRFDLDGNGEISEQEMALVRAQALREVKRNDPDIDQPLHTMSKPKDGRPFIISHHTQKKLVFWHYMHSLFYVLLFVVATVNMDADNLYSKKNLGIFWAFAQKFQANHR